MLSLLPALLAGAVTGAVTGVVATRWFLNRRCGQVPVPADEPDPWVSAEIDQAAASWATVNGKGSEAAELMADKLHLLHHLGQRRGWWS